MKKIIFLVIALALIAGGCTMPWAKNKVKNITLEESKAKSVDFINNYLMQPGSTVTAKEAVEENGLYKVTILMSSGQEIISYMTKDGTKFFPQAMEIAKYEEQAKTDETKTDTQAQTDTNKTETPTETAKQDKPKVEVFVMSHCPYGTQIEKGLLPVMEKLGNKADIEIKFCSYAMHGEKELKEQMNQYCINKNEPTKFQVYLKCFLGAGDGESCIKQEGINKSKLDSCVSATDKQYKVMANFADKSTWTGNYPGFAIFKADNEKYGVQGSPTLVVNGKTVSSGRDSASLLKAICAGFKTPPEECKATLSSESPSAGFGFGVSNSGTDAGCGT